MKIFAFLVCFVVFSIYETFGIEKTYPLKKPLFKGTICKYRIAIISNSDRRSRVRINKWRSILKKGWLTVHKKGHRMTVKEIKWDQKVVKLDSNIHWNGRAMEMSGLVTFNGKLYTCDKATGMVYELLKGISKLRGFVRLKAEKDSVFKCKWMTVKDNKLIVGRQGRVMKNDGNKSPEINMWIIRVDPKGNMQNKKRNSMVYAFYRKPIGYRISGYLNIEAANWSEKQKKWFVLHRTSSFTDDPVEDKNRVDNKLYIADEVNKSITIKRIGPLKKNRRFTSFKFIPDSDEKIFLALKVRRKRNRFSTFIEVYDINGKMLRMPQKIANDKYEGLEFI